MSAQVFGCGQAHHLMEIECVTRAPQVHIHFLTSGEEYVELGYGKLELCCHGCGESSLVYYREGGSTLLHRKAKEDFISKHSSCKNRNFQESCPNYRSSFGVLDLRNTSEDRAQKPTLRRKKAPRTKLSS